MIICQALLGARRKLAKNNITSAGLDAEVILGYVLSKSREWILANPQLSIINYQLSKYERLINKRIKGVPVAYLTNHKSFFGLDFYVDERVLIPRPETEMLVQETLETLETLETWETLGHETRGTKHVTIADIGTGSGCVAVAIAKQLKARLANLAFREVTIYGIDISKDALAVARKNARRYNVNIKFLQGDLLEPIIKRKIRPDIIVANLPYLKSDQIKGDIRHEPKKALLGGKDGLRFYERLLKQVGGWQALASLQGRGVMIFEIDPGQTGAMKKLIKKYLPGRQVGIKKDWAGRERMVIVNF